MLLAAGNMPDLKQHRSQYAAIDTVCKPDENYVHRIVRHAFCSHPNTTSTSYKQVKKYEQQLHLQSNKINNNMLE